jgi:ferredoxin
MAVAGQFGRLSVNPIACDGHGLCAELLGGHIRLDDWGYPILTDQDIPKARVRDAKRAVRDCPALALRLVQSPGPGSA